MSTSSAIVAGVVEGSHVLKIEGYSRTKRLRNGNYIKSSTFEVGGRSWSIKYYPDGVKSEDVGWISFFLMLHHKSSADDVEASFKFSLLDEIGEPVPSYSMGPFDMDTFDATNCSWGYVKFMEKKTLEESIYLRDDCFRVRCDVNVAKEFWTENRPQFVIVPPSDMLQHIGRLLSSQDTVDVTFEVRGETFDAHSQVLAARSSVFMAELFGPMKKSMRNIRIQDMEGRVFKAMLHFIYNDSLPEMEEGDALAMVQHLLVAADRYGLERLKLVCEEKLCSSVNVGTAATTLALAEQHGCIGLKEACFEFLKSSGNMKKVMESDGFEHLKSSCPSLLVELLAKVAP